jgi:hypothetical protein
MPSSCVLPRMMYARTFAYPRCLAHGRPPFSVELCLGRPPRVAVGRSHWSDRAGRIDFHCHCDGEEPLLSLSHLNANLLDVAFRQQIAGYLSRDHGSFALGSMDAWKLDAILVAEGDGTIMDVEIESGHGASLMSTLRREFRSLPP